MILFADRRLQRHFEHLARDELFRNRSISTLANGS